MAIILGLSSGVLLVCALELGKVFQYLTSTLNRQQQAALSAATRAG